MSLNLYANAGRRGFPTPAGGAQAVAAQLKKIRRAKRDVVSPLVFHQRTLIKRKGAETVAVAGQANAVNASQTATAGEVKRPGKELWKWAILAGLLAVLSEWWVYAARVK